MTQTEYERVSLDESDQIVNEEDNSIQVNSLDDDTVKGDPALSADLDHHDRKSNVIPWKQLYVLYLITICDSISLSIVAPFLPEMCRVRFGISEENVGIASGFLIGGFSLATFMTSFFIGHLSDSYGRKKLMLMGLFTGTFCTFCFGLAQSFYLAMFLRLLAGATNANTSLCKSVIADITIGQARTLAFAYQAAAFSLARAISSSLSGMTTGVIISGIPLFNDPYFLPCLVGASVNATGFICTLIFIPETLKNNDPTKRNKSKFSIKEGLKEMGRDKLMRKLVVTFCLNSFTNGGILLAMVLIMSLSIDNHGLGFSPLENGLFYTWFGACSAIFQIFFFKRVLGRLGTLSTYSMGTYFLATGTFLLPTATLFYWLGGVTSTMKTLTYITLSIAGTSLSVGFMTALPVISTMQSNAANQARIGLVTGTAQSLSGLLRSMGPPMSGMIFSLGVAIKFPFVLFWFLVVIYFICQALLKSLSPDELRRADGEQFEVELAEKKETEQASLLIDQDQEESNKSNV